MPGTEAHSTGAAPLSGIRVLEFCHAIMGPTAGLILADLGADVIKVEPADGDTTRRLIGFAAGFFADFQSQQAQPRHRSQGRPKAARCCIGSRRLPTWWSRITRPAPWTGSAAAMPIFRQINPRLVYCALKGFLSGPYEHRPALDEVVQFMAGLAYMTGPPGQPLRAGSSVVDIMGGMFAVIAIQAALRERDDRPRPIDQVGFVRSRRVHDGATYGRQRR